MVKDKCNIMAEDIHLKKNSATAYVPLSLPLILPSSGKTPQLEN